MPETILVVDDSPTQRHNLKLILSDAGYRVLEARDGQEGLEIARRETPDLVLSDVEMPRKTGYEMCEALMGEPDTAGIPVIFLSNLDGPESVRRGFMAGAQGFLSKYEEPPDSIIERVHEFLQGRRPDLRGMVAPCARRAPPMTSFEMVSFGVALLNLNRELVYANRQARRVFGLGPDQEFSTVDPARVQDVLRRALSSIPERSPRFLHPLEGGENGAMVRIEEYYNPRGIIEGLLFVFWQPPPE